MAIPRVDQYRRSCARCKFLYTHGEGYSNYTWEDTYVNCALNRNPNLPAAEPDDWTAGSYQLGTGAALDNWPATQFSQCGDFQPVSEGCPRVELDVDGEEHPWDHSNDVEQIIAIIKHCVRYDV